MSAFLVGVSHGLIVMGTLWLILGDPSRATAHYVLACWLLLEMDRRWP